jgi:hypothetical protein
MSIKTKVLAAAATLTIAGGLSTAETLPASAATPRTTPGRVLPGCSRRPGAGSGPAPKRSPHAYGRSVRGIEWGVSPSRPG